MESATDTSPEFEAATAVVGSDGVYEARLRPEWSFWGPFGGYLAAITLRAAAAHSSFPRPAALTCHFIGRSTSDTVVLRTQTVRKGSAVECIRVSMQQAGRPVVEAMALTADAALEGIEHSAAPAPEVPEPESLQNWTQLADDFETWPPLYGVLEGRPTEFTRRVDVARDPTWHAWLRLNMHPTRKDPFLQAARTLINLDFSMWCAARRAHAGGVPYIAPTVELSAHFHDALFSDGVAAEPWLLTDSRSPVAARGIVSANGRVWSRGREVLATGISQLVCRRLPPGAFV